MRGLTLVPMLVGTTLAATTLAGAAWGQNLTEYGAAAAGGSVGGASGKKVSDGINNIFDKVSGTANKASATGKPAAQPPAAKQQPASEVSAGVSRDDGSGVPPPPETHAAVRKPAPEPPPPAVTVAEVPPAAPPPPPPPQMTTENLKQIAPGVSREDVLKLGVPSAQITMIEDGHLVEVYDYIAHGENLGRVRLTDGAVASVQAH
jgi:hypothetical protein